MLFFHIILLIALVQIDAWKTTGPEVEVINSIENGRHVITQIIRPVHGEEIVQTVVGAKVVGAKKAWKRSVEETNRQSYGCRQRLLLHQQKRSTKQSPHQQQNPKTPKGN